MSGYRDDSPHGGLIPTHELQRRNVEAAYEEKITRLRAEVERLAAQVVEAEKYNGWHQRACLENERLRAALRGVIADCSVCGGTGLLTEYDVITDKYLWRDCCLCKEARAALEEKS